MLFVVGIAVLASLLATPLALSQTDAGAPAPVAVEMVEEDGGPFDRLTDVLVDFQRRANAEVSFHMNAIERGEDFSAFLLALAVAFAYGAVHALGPGHGKFVVVSYFLGREARVMRGVVMAVQIAIVHVIAAIVIVWLADLVLQGQLRTRAVGRAGRARRKLPHHRRHRHLHALSGRARLAERHAPTARTAVNTIIITGMATTTATITIMGTATALAARRKAASSRWRPGWSPAPGPC